MSQQSIDVYLRQRKETVKRKAGPDESSVISNKIRIIENDHTDCEETREFTTLTTPNGCNTTYKTVKLISNKKDALKIESSKCKGKAVVKLSFDNVKAECVGGHPPQIESKNPDGSKTVKFFKRGLLSPKKKTKDNGDITSYLTKTDPEQILEPDSSESVLVPDKVKAERKQLSLGDIKKCVKLSSRSNELRNYISRMNKGFDRLKELNAHTNTDPQVSTLKEFKSIELLVPASPVKNSPAKSISSGPEPLMSPRKTSFSPIKSPVKIPAYERLASLAVPTPSLILPHHFRWVAEVFKGIEQVSSMMYNRKETITFSKVRLAVQEMLRRNITEKHLRQIKHLSPEMYTFTREKVKNFGATARKDEYELVLQPKVLDQTGSISSIMTPAIILSRQRSFYNLLLDKVKDHHAEFLISLDPPLNISKDKLNRWHPEFDLEHIPDIEEGILPEAPNTEKFSTAQDVLTHYRQQFNVNSKMEKALLRLAEAKTRGLTAEEQKVTGLKADGSVPIRQTNGELKPSEAGASCDAPINPAFKGLPKALLEKVRAKQAAKALESMTRSPAQENDSKMYQRLPDFARLVRNLFVTEKKSVLPFENVISKLSNCLRIKMSNDDLIRHIRLLSKELPTWLTFYEFRKTEFLKIVKDAEMAKIMRQLGDLAAAHSG